MIESGTNVAAVIKSHHNGGALPDFVDFKEIIEPLRLLFKDEVRALGRELGLPEYLVMRQPFPGPGLAIRCLGAVSKDKLDILRDADFIFRDEIAKAHLEQTMNQYFAVLTNMRSVGVMGDGRSSCAASRRRTSCPQTGRATRMMCSTVSPCASSTRSRASTASSMILRPNRPPRSSGNNPRKAESLENAGLLGYGIAP